jgi:Xaa-Pro aminopeptidase
MSGAKPEIFINVDRLNLILDENGLDAIVARSGRNFTYLSGLAYPGTLARLLDLPDSDRGVMVLWPRNGEPVVIVNDTAAGLAARDSWIERQVIYEGYVESPYSRLAEVLKAEGLAKARVGFEQDYVSARDWALVDNAVPGMEMVDCTAIMDRVRWIKTPSEVERIKTAADLLDDVFLDVFPGLRPGDTERLAHSRIIGGCLERGFNWAHGILNSSTNTIPYAGESDVIFYAGDVMRTDYVAYLDGYPGHQSRNLIFGEPTQKQRDEYRSIRDIYRATIDKCRPGARVGDIYDFAVNAFTADGWKFESLLVGHGVGSWWHQQEPILRRGSDILLEEGMVLALEPHIGHWHIQDMVVLRKNGPELLSNKMSTDEPFITAGN